MGHIRRRQFLLAAAGVFVVPCAIAQAPGKLPRIALLASTDEVDAMNEDHVFWGPFLRELRGLGYLEGKSVAVQRWSGRGNIASYDAITKKVVADRPDVIFVWGRGMTASIAAATKSIPIVSLGTIPSALHAGHARPGSNVTGLHISFDEAQLYGKQVEFLRRLTKPGARIAWLGPQNSWDSIIGQAARNGAIQVGLILDPVIVASPVNEAAIRAGFASMAITRFQGLYVAPAIELRPYRRLIAELAMAARLPSIGLYEDYADAGMLISYGVELQPSFRRAAHYVDRILKGAKPGDLPIEQPTKFVMVINLKTANALGIALPFDLQLRADRVIE